jgi:hypothetical protein
MAPAVGRVARLLGDPPITSSIRSGSIPARRTASRMAAAPSCCSDNPSSCPQKAPSGVRAALTTITRFIDNLPFQHIDFESDNVLIPMTASQKAPEARRATPEE